MDILYTHPKGFGYQPVLHMAHLAQELFQADLHIFAQGRRLGVLQKTAIFWPGRSGDEQCLVICTSPTELQTILFTSRWRKKYKQVVAWIFDSFWVNHIPWWVRKKFRIFDKLYVTEQEDIQQWRRLTKIPTSWLPWGADALRLGSANGNRPFDVLRVGRQPREWDDDENTARLCRALGLNFHGRPPFGNGSRENYRQLLATMAQTRSLLAWNNRISPSVQTHPEREYITGRWTDALAAGAIVAGIPPQTETVRELLWEEGLLRLSSTDLLAGLGEIKEALADWTPASARLNWSKALQRLDWRWRFRVIADELGLDPTPLKNELNEIRTLVASGSTP